MGDEPVVDTPSDELVEDAMPLNGRRRRSRVDLPRALTLAMGVGGGLVLAQVVTATAARLRSLLILVLLSLFLSFAMEPAVQWLHNRGVRRGIGTGLVFAAAALLGGGAVLSVYGLVIDQATNLVESAPTLLESLAERAAELPESVAGPVGEFLDEQSTLAPQRLNDAAAELGRSALGLGSTLIGVVFSSLTVLLITFYLVADGPRLRWQLSRRLEPARQREFLRVWELAIAKTGGYVYSRLLLAVASTIVHVTAFTMADLPYPLALGVWVGVISSIIPVVGLYIAGALPLIVSLANGEASTITVIVVITVYQQIENYLVQPRITEHTLALHPAVGFLAVLVGGALLGPVGAFLALPVAAIVAALVLAYAEEHDVLEHGLTTTPAARVPVRERRRTPAPPAKPSRAGRRRHKQEPDPDTDGTA